MEYAFCARSRRAVSLIGQCPWYVPPTSHQWPKPALILEDNLLTWDDDPRGIDAKAGCRADGPALADGDKRLIGKPLDG